MSDANARLIIITVRFCGKHDSPGNSSENSSPPPLFGFWLIFAKVKKREEESENKHSEYDFEDDRSTNYSVVIRERKEPLPLPLFGEGVIKQNIELRRRETATWKRYRAI